MKMILKLCLLILTLMFSGQSLNAVQVWNEDLRDLDFKTVASGLKERKLVQIGDEKYAVCLKNPKLYSAIYKKEVRTNPCYQFGLGPKLLKPTDLENLPDPWPSFFANNAAKDESGEYITVNFTTRSSPHWKEAFFSPVPMEKRYWNEDHTAGWVPLRYVSFLLKKI